MSDCTHNLILRRGGGVRLYSRFDLKEGRGCQTTEDLILRRGGGVRLY